MHAHNYGLYPVHTCTVHQQRKYSGTTATSNAARRNLSLNETRLKKRGLKEILSYFGHVKNDDSIEENLKIIAREGRKTAAITINHKGTSMIKDEED